MLIRNSSITSIITCIVLVVLGVLCSPYKKYSHFASPMVEQSVEVNIPDSLLFKYLGNSKNAENWSVYVDHINPLNADSVPDGAVGSCRRCYCEPNQDGKQWDERIEYVQPYSKRTLSTYNFVNFSLMASGLLTDQTYTRLSPTTTKVSLSLYYDHPPSLVEQAKMHFASYQVALIFKRNLNNIKYFSEQAYIHHKHNEF